MNGGPGSGGLLRRLAIEPPALPRGLLSAVDATPLPPVDHRTADYILAVRGGFERLSDAARQMAALLILEAAGAAPARDHPARILARRDIDEARQIVRASKCTPRAAHHHRHLTGAIAAFDMILAELPPDPGADTIPHRLAILRQATDHLRWAASALPGFEVVALGQGCGCCAPPLRHPYPSLG